MKKLFVLFTGLLLLALQASAAPALKYAGTIAINPNGMHRDGVTGQIQLYSENDQLTQIVVKTDKPVFGKTEFPSVEQAMITSRSGTSATMGLAFRLQGPPHKWYYIFVGQSADNGATFSGKMMSAKASLEDIEAALSANQIPDSWKEEGTANFAIQQ